MRGKDYKLIAEIMHETKPFVRIELAYWNYLVKVFAETLQYHNYDFGKEKFINACKEERS